MLLNIFYGPLTLPKRLQGLVLLVTCITASITRWNWSIDVGPIQVINAFLKFEERIIKNLPFMPISMGTRTMKIFIFLIQIFEFVYAILLWILLRFLPCTPPFILSMFENCGGAEFGGLTELGDTDIFSCIRLYRYVQALEKSLNAYVTKSIVPVILTRVAAELPVTRAGSSRYPQITGIRKNCAGMRVTGTRPVTRGNPNTNVILAFLPFKSSGCMSASNFMKKLPSLDSPYLYCSPLLQRHNIFVITLASRVNASSKRVLKILSGKIVGFRGAEMRHLRRELAACGVLKIKFGNNFIDNGTPLVMQNFCINQTLSLCMVKDGKLVN
ncbi:hypothetical protein Fcan01_22900 [Folsomia candida]|uniref:Uncharacterized protein n=1 Tax=Folsomia candida TaxID=158441 RepID=A0A226DB85_FOLCA|nr:hypothetical protein Fcan01_22900 [Folsomia candida]